MSAYISEGKKAGGGDEGLTGGIFPGTHGFLRPPHPAAGTETSGFPTGSPDSRPKYPPPRKDRSDRHEPVDSRQ